MNEAWMFLLNAEICGGVGVGYSTLKRTHDWTQEIEKILGEKNKKNIRGHFAGAQVFLGYAVMLQNWKMGLEAYGGAHFLDFNVNKSQDYFRPRFYGGAKALLGYCPIKSICIYGNVGYEADYVANTKFNDFDEQGEKFRFVTEQDVDRKKTPNYQFVRNEKDPTWHPHLVVGGGFNYYFNSYIGLGVSVDYRFMSGSKAGGRDVLPIDKVDLKHVEVLGRTTDHFRVMVKLVIKNSDI